MIFTDSQFEALAYIFEQANGNKKDDYELKVISESGLSDLKADQLEQHVVDGLDKGLYNEIADRISAYWVLGKRFNRNLIPLFRKWLRNEVEQKNDQAVYQLLISLSNLEEPVFNSDRDGGSASGEKELNMRDASNYLKKTSA